jgi:hypothetical protein
METRPGTRSIAQGGHNARRQVSRTWSSPENAHATSRNTYSAPRSADQQANSSSSLSVTLRRPKGAHADGSF